MNPEKIRPLFLPVTFLIFTGLILYSLISAEYALLPLYSAGALISIAYYLFFRSPEAKNQNIMKDRLIGQNMVSIDDGIEDILGYLCGVLNAVRGYVFLYSGDGRLLYNTHEWTAPGQKEYIRELHERPAGVLQWWEARIRAGEPVIIDDTEKLPPSAAGEKKILRSQRTGAALAFPLLDGNRVIGYIGAESDRPRRWKRPELNLFSRISRLVSDGVSRLIPPETPKEKEIFFKQIVDNIKEVFFMTSSDFQRFIYISPLIEEMWQIPIEELYRDPGSWISLVHPGDADRIAAALEYARNDAEQFNEEFRIIRGDGSVRWIWVRMFPVPGSNGTAGAAGIIEDITERKETELELVKVREYEFEVGARIQRTLLLDEPCLSAETIAAKSLSSHRVDGDFYHFFCFDDSSMDMAVGDVMGKGISAALVSAAVKSVLLRSKLRLTVGSSGRAFPEPKDILKETHKSVVGNLFDLGSFITLYYGRYSFVHRFFDFVDCGHTPIIHYRESTGTCWLMKGANVPLGMLKWEKYKQYSVPLAPGDLLFFFSDGVTEAVNSAGEVFGMDRLLKFVAAQRGTAPEKFIETLTGIIFQYSGGNLRDDVTGVCIKVPEESGEKWEGRETEFPGNVQSLPALRNFIREGMPSGGLTESRIEGFILAGNEAFSNIVNHGLSGDDQIIETEMYRNSGCCFLRLTYLGIPFNWTAYPDHLPVPGSETGYGIPLMETTTDSVLYSEDTGGKRSITLVVKMPDLPV
ncbi:MAG: SpoIIE family protein phosphatase [Spirochaetia bacterium]